jgi:hypothetical protein
VTDVRERRRLARRRSRPRTTLTARDQQRLLAVAKESPRALLLYHLAVRIGLGARDCAALDVIDVSPDGLHARASMSVRSLDRRRRGQREFQKKHVDHESRAAIEQYLAWRRARCSHFRITLRTIKDAGVERCHSCHEPVDLLSSPLFLGRRARRTAAQWLRQEFRERRSHLRLPSSVRFDDLRKRGKSAQQASSVNATAQASATKEEPGAEETSQGRPGEAIATRDRT